jgi:hypothetical protein
MYWNLVLMGMALLFLVLAAGTQVATPVAQADNLVEKIAPQFSLPEAPLREAIRIALSEGQDRRAVFDAAPWLVMVALLVIRMLVERRAAARVRS